MKNLYPLTNLPLPYYSAIIERKYRPRKPILKALETVIKRLYQNYSDNTHQLHLLTPENLTDEQKEALRHCYSPAVPEMDELRLIIEEFQEQFDDYVSAVCQYCGLNFSPRTLDHYLPKDLFAEFSTLSLNLVPCCGDCNGLKGVAWLDSNSNRRIISFYYDSLPTKQFLFASIRIVNKKIKTSFYLSSDSEDYCGLEPTIRSHFSKLELIERYEKAAPEVISEQRTSLKSIYPLEISALEIFLIKKIKCMSQDFSLNYWKVALYQAMLNNKDFLTWCIN